LWSPISLINIIIFGPNIYREMVRGASEIDNHFLNTPFKKNIPFLLAFLSFIHINFLKNLAHGYLIYSNYLEDFIPYLQQLEMESLGKSYQRSNIISKYKTSPIVWGGIGTNCQHAFMQQVHQGNIGSNFDLILTLNNDDKKDSLDKFMFANYLAQSDTLISGNLNSQSNFKKIIGGKGHSIIILKNMRAKNLGSLISLYENKVFALSCILNINAFDQWGVEEGKKIANEYIKKIEKKQGTKKNSLLNEILKNTKN
jgi:glucose-6-phosphate isomerase